MSKWIEEKKKAMEIHHGKKILGFNISFGVRRTQKRIGGPPHYVLTAEKEKDGKRVFIQVSLQPVTEEQIKEIIIRKISSDPKNSWALEDNFY